MHIYQDQQFSMEDVGWTAPLSVLRKDNDSVDKMMGKKDEEPFPPGRRHIVV